MDASRFWHCSHATRLFLILALFLLLAGMLGCGGDSGKFLRLGPGQNNGMLNGQYAFTFSGQDSSGFLIMGAGSFTADGAGNISSGTEDVTVAGSGSQSLTLTGTYAVGADGRGTAFINTSKGPATWQFTMVTSSQALLIRFDLGTITASGTIDKQDTTTFSTASLNGDYVFGLSGLGGNGGPLATAGSWTMDGAGTITSGIIDVNDFDFGVIQNDALSGNYSVASTGRGTASVTSGYATQNFVFYVVNATTLKFLETDALPAVSGEVLRAATPYTAATLNGGLAFTLGGVDVFGSPLAEGGVITADGNGNLSGVLDINDAGAASLGGAISGTYAFDTSGRGTADIPSTSLGSMQLALYPAQNGTIELVEIDLNNVLSGMAKAQSGLPFSASSISGPFAVNFTGVLSSSGGLTEEDITGQLSADGGGNFTGTLDINTLVSRTQGAAVSASPYSMSGNGRGAATINIPGATFNLQIYQIDSATALALDVDNFRLLVGVIKKQQ
jgi:hypothetical protein